MSHTPTPHSADRPLREVLTAFVLVGGASVCLHLLGRVIPLIGANLTFFVALLFLLVPGYFLRKRGESDNDYGLDFSDGWRGAGVGLLVAVVTLAGFLPAHHAWMTRVEGRSFYFDLGHYRRPSERFFGAPANAPDARVQVWTHGPQLSLQWLPEARPYSLEIQTLDGSATLAASPADLSNQNLQSRIVVSGEGVHDLSFRIHPAGAPGVELRAMTGGRTLDSHEFTTAGGAPIDRKGGTTIRFSYWWMVSIVLTHFLLVALPEEFFYRGYMQKRLAGALGDRRWKIGPLVLTMPILFVSAVFALGHLFIGFGVHRLLVFFPSLLFGALREKTGGIIAPTVYHALCNLMVYAAAMHYF